MTKPSFSRLLLAIVILTAGRDFACAQVTATISGKVEDASGAAVGGAIVAVKNVETGATRMVMTDEMGNYRALSLPVGSHDVRAEKPGFRAAVRTGINLAVGQEAVVNLKLEDGHSLYSDLFVDRPQGLLLFYRGLLALDLTSTVALRAAAAGVAAATVLVVAAIAARVGGRVNGYATAGLLATLGASPLIEAVTLSGQLLAALPP